MDFSSIKSEMVLRIQIEADDTGLLFATSPDLHGLLVAKTSRSALEAAIPVAVANLFAADGHRVVVEKIGTDLDRWRVVPSNVLAGAY
jgi:hypothetical protein